jgi:transcription elongation GreA/GreB family factor
MPYLASLRNARKSAEGALRREKERRKKLDARKRAERLALVESQARKRSSALPEGAIGIGCMVVLRCDLTGETVTFVVVPTQVEAPLNPDLLGLPEGMECVSHLSPLGKQLCGHVVGEEVQLESLHRIVEVQPHRSCWGSSPVEAAAPEPDYRLPVYEGAGEGDGDGGALLGYLAREEGRYGSLPEFDDYSDGAGPSFQSE